MTTNPSPLVSLQPGLVQKLYATALVAFGILTQAVPALHLPLSSSGMLAIFGLLLHPDATITPKATTLTLTPTAKDPIP